jgi:hypothetical protein
MKALLFQWAISFCLMIADIIELSRVAGTTEAFAWAALSLAAFGLWVTLSLDLLEESR